MARFYISKLTFLRKSLQNSLTVFQRLVGFYLSSFGVSGSVLYCQKQLFRFSHEDQQCMIDILQLLLEELRITSDMLQGLRNP